MKYSIKARLILNMSILLIATVIMLGTAEIISLNSAYNKNVETLNENFDTNIRLLTENIVSSLQVNYDRFLNGEITEEEAMENNIALIRDSRYDKDGYFWADMADGLCVVHMNPANVGQMRLDTKDMAGNYYVRSCIENGDNGGGYSDFWFAKPGEDPNTPFKKRGYTLKFEPYGWYVSTGNYVDDIEKEIAKFNEAKMESILVLLVLVALTLAAAVVVAIVLAGKIGKPIKSLAGMLGRVVSTGNFELDAEALSMSRLYAEKKDEIGEIARSVNDLIDMLSIDAREMEAISNGDLTVEAVIRSQDDMLGNALCKMLDSLNSMFASINGASRQVSTGSRQIADGSQTLAQGSTEQASAVGRLSSSIQEISEKTKTNAEIANKAAQLAITIKDNAEKGSKQMDEMMAAVREINQASQNIGKVIKVIDDIAFQTNILALNAAVEAARAGQHGKGFAVVADEVRNLAAKSAEAAKDTGGLITNSIEKAELGARIADETAASLVEIVSGINESTQLVGEIAKSSEEQTAGISQINTGIDQVAQIIHQNSAAAEESAVASEEMRNQAEMLESLVAQFELKDQGNRNTTIDNAREPEKQLSTHDQVTAYALSGKSGDSTKY